MKFKKEMLKNGVFGVGLEMKTNKEVNFVVVNDKLIYQDGTWDRIGSFNDKGKNNAIRIEMIVDKCLCFNCIKHSNVIYRHEPLYNGKVVCVDLGDWNTCYTKGKIYQFKDGILTTDTGDELGDHCNGFTSFEHWQKFSNSKWLEIVE